MKWVNSENRSALSLEPNTLTHVTVLLTMNEKQERALIKTASRLWYKDDQLWFKDCSSVTSLSP